MLFTTLTLLAGQQDGHQTGL